MKIVISKEQSERMAEIIHRIISSMDFEGGVKSFTVSPPDYEEDFPTYDIMLNLNYDWIQENQHFLGMYIRNVKVGVREKIKDLTGLSNIYVWTKME